MQDLDAERRKYMRVNRDIPVRITIPDIDGEGVEAHLASITRNVSLGGVLIEFSAIREEMWSKLKEEGAVVTLEMYFPDIDQRMSVQASVKWLNEANKLLAQYASVGLSVIWDTEINPQFPALTKKLKEMIDAG